MNRKLVKHGESTLMVSLPSKWLQHNNLKKGDEINIEEEKDTIIISSEENKKELKKLTATISKGNNSYTKAIVSNAYKKGYDEIELKYQDEDLTAEVQKITSNLLGMEMYDSDSNHCTLKNVAIGLREEFDPMLKKVFLLVQQNSEKTIIAVEKNKFDDYENVNQTRLNITRYTDFCKRLLAKYYQHDDVMLFKYTIIYILEKISNQYAYMYRYGVEEKPKKFSKECIQYFKDTNTMFESFFHAFYSKNIEKIKESNQQKDTLLFKKLYSMRHKITPDDIIIVHHLSSIIRRCTDFTGPFFGIIN